ncbi:MAG: hypothetical protein Q8O56_11625 [Solirubrobacteraceae bacterium]|nr:hypothetical protein [Solirubrobacteraceae bacterium]
MSPRAIGRLARSCALTLLALLALAGCGQQRAALAPSCLDETAMLAALQRAPGPVALDGATPLSRCISSARDGSDLRSLGHSFTRLTDTLRAQAATDADAALRLGYVAGAVRAGASRTSSGIADQLARRVEQLATLRRDAGTAADAAYRRGLAAGERDG